MMSLPESGSSRRFSETPFATYIVAPFRIFTPFFTVEPAEDFVDSVEAAVRE